MRAADRRRFLKASAATAVQLRPIGAVVAGVAFGRPYQSPFDVR